MAMRFFPNMILTLELLTIVTMDTIGTIMASGYVNHVKGKFRFNFWVKNRLCETSYSIGFYAYKYSKRCSLAATINVPGLPPILCYTLHLEVCSF